MGDGMSDSLNNGPSVFTDDDLSALMVDGDECTNTRLLARELLAWRKLWRNRFSDITPFDEENK